MPQAPGIVRVGTSGWQYRHWVGHFYPDKTAPARMLHFYGGHFSTTEINSTFYRLPDPAAVSAWRNATPTGFVFACKANRYITHMKKLKDPAESLAAFSTVVDTWATRPALFCFSCRRAGGSIPAGLPIS